MKFSQKFSHWKLVPCVRVTHNHEKLEAESPGSQSGKEPRVPAMLYP